jgi:hypothetical protein
MAARAAVGAGLDNQAFAQIRKYDVTAIAPFVAIPHQDDLIIETDSQGNLHIAVRDANARPGILLVYRP